MFGKNKEEKAQVEAERREKVASKAAEADRIRAEILAKRKQDYVDEKMKLSEKELFVELLWHMDELNQKTESINNLSRDIEYNTKPSNQPSYELSKY